MADDRPFRKIEPERVSDMVRRRIEDLILRGILRPGTRLPAERELAEQLEVSRPSVRAALAALEASGLVVLRPGSGAYVAEVLGSAFSPALIELFASHDRALFDYLAFRRDLEGLAAFRAATEGSAADLAVIDAAFGRMEAAHRRRSAEEEAALDADFHMAIVEAAHNIVMLHMLRSMFDLLRRGVFYNRQVLFSVRATREDLLDQHRAIRDAILARDGEAARAAVADHLGYIETAMRALDRARDHEEVARMRLALEEGQRK